MVQPPKTESMPIDSPIHDPTRIPRFNWGGTCSRSNITHQRACQGARSYDAWGLRGGTGRGSRSQSWVSVGDEVSDRTLPTVTTSDLPSLYRARPQARDL